MASNDEVSGVRRRPTVFCEHCWTEVTRTLGLTLRGVSSRACPDCFSALVAAYQEERFGPEQPEPEELEPELRREILQQAYENMRREWLAAHRPMVERDVTLTAAPIDAVTVDLRARSRRGRAA